MEPNLPESQDVRIVLEPCGRMRAAARDALRGHWGGAILATLIFYLILQVPGILLTGAFGGSDGTLTYDAAGGGIQFHPGEDGGGSFASTLYSLLVYGPMSYGISRFFLELRREGTAQVSSVMAGFSRFGKTFLLGLYITFFIFLWALLFIIPGIIAAYRYSQAFFILNEHPDWSVVVCVEESKRRMKGNKGMLFLLDLSYIGWLFLAALPAGIIGAVLAEQGINVQGPSMGEQLIFLALSLPEIFVIAYIYAGRTVFYEILTGR